MITPTVIDRTRTDARWYALDRIEDPTGISGTGRIVYLVDLDEAGVLLLWDTYFDQKPSQGIEWLPDLDWVRRIHGHNGATRLVPLAGSPHALRTGRWLLWRAMAHLVAAGARLVMLEGDVTRETTDVLP